MRFTKAMKLRAGKVPEAHPALSGIIPVYNGVDRKWAFIRFSEVLVEHVGKIMPSGIGPDNPAYLRVSHTGRQWKIFALYMFHPSRRQQGRVLAVLQSKPVWLNPK
jgi:hypothetical protein